MTTSETIEKHGFTWDGKKATKGDVMITQGNALRPWVRVRVMPIRPGGNCDFVHRHHQAFKALTEALTNKGGEAFGPDAPKGKEKK